MDGEVINKWHGGFALEELTDRVDQKRATGRSTRIVDDIIQDFFNKPIGTIIPIYDHFNGVNFNFKNPDRSDYGHYGRYSNRYGIMRQADERILKVVKGRLKYEHGNVKYKVITGNPQMQEERREDVSYHYAIIRETPTIKELYNKLKESYCEKDNV